MAIENNVDITQPNFKTYIKRFRNASKSFVSTAGNNASFIIVPADEIWELQTLRGFNGEAAAREMQFLLTDADGTEHVTLSLNPNPKESVPASGILGWNGSVIVPAGWRVYTKWFAMAGGSSCNWQFTALAYDLDSVSPTVL